jgi:hypothetical protein
VVPASSHHFMNSGMTAKHPPKRGLEVRMPHDVAGDGFPAMNMDMWLCEEHKSLC